MSITTDWLRARASSRRVTPRRQAVSWSKRWKRSSASWRVVAARSSGIAMRLLLVIVLRDVLLNTRSVAMLRVWRKTLAGVVDPPSPPGGGVIFGRKILIFNGLQGIDICKIFITNGLWLKYLLSIGWPRWMSGLSLFLISVFSIAVGAKLMRQADVVVL